MYVIKSNQTESREVQVKPSVCVHVARAAGGIVNDADIKAGRAVNVSAVPPPAQNFKFGNYSFTLKATDPATGGLQEGCVLGMCIHATRARVGRMHIPFAGVIWRVDSPTHVWGVCIRKCARTAAGTNSRSPY